MTRPLWQDFVEYFSKSVIVCSVVYFSTWKVCQTIEAWWQGRKGDRC